MPLWHRNRHLRKHGLRSAGVGKVHVLKLNIAAGKLSDGAAILFRVVALNINDTRHRPVHGNNVHNAEHR